MKKGISCFVGLICITGGLFAAIPIQDKSFQGAAAAADARLRLIAAAESFLGVPYRYAGIDRNGLDCSGLVYRSFRDGLGVPVPRSSDRLYAWVERIPDSGLQPGDLVFFATGGHGVSHLGIYTGGGRFIHSASEGPRTGVIYSRLDEAYWQRTYLGAGRALPWDDGAAGVIAGARAGTGEAPAGGAPAEVAEAAGAARESRVPGSPSAVWEGPGFFMGAGAAWTWGGFIQGAPSVFRGFSVLATAGYKTGKYRVGLEVRPEWDRALGVFRLPFTLAAGTDIFQVFAGPAYTAGEPALSLDGRKRQYLGRGWNLAAGVSGAFPPFRAGQGALSVYGELAWQPYRRKEGDAFSFKPDVTANIRFSTGVRYLWHVGD